MARDFGHEDGGRATGASLEQIVRNRVIDTFLETDDRVYLVGPKGTGKTLLLKRKAIDKRTDGGVICIPTDTRTPVDRLTATQHIGEKFNRFVSDPKESVLAWATVWKHAIYRSVLHHLRDRVLEAARNLDEKSKGMKWADELALVQLQAVRSSVERLLATTSHIPNAPFYYYTEVCRDLDSAPRHHIDRIRKEVTDLESILRLVRQDVYVFLDNLDDYYELYPDLWFQSMYGQFRAVREITNTHPNVHVFTSLRRDVYAQFKDELTLQHYDYIALLEYTRDQILCIFETVIKRLDPDLLMIPSLRESNPWEAFFGKHIALENRFVGVQERIQDYIFRHSLGRPRDMVHLGTVLLNKRPTSGFDDMTIRRAVAEGSETIAEQYLKEVRPMVDGRINLTDFIRRFMPSNIVRRERLIQSLELYRQSCGLDHVESISGQYMCPFAVLFRFGLLGISQRDVGTDNLVQHFEPPGQGPVWADSPELPDAEYYFLHPALNYLLGPSSKSKEMVVGYGYSVGNTGGYL